MIKRIIGGGGIVLVLAGVSALAASRMQDLPQVPTEWVQFTADVKVSRGDRVEWDRIYRGADGSTRTEQFNEKGQTYAIAISSVPEQKLYRWREGRNWIVTPMRLALRPPSGVSPGFVLVSAEETTSKLLGLKLTNQQGMETIVAPALNFYAIEMRNAETGQDRVLTNVRIGPQDPALFAPPAEARNAQIVNVDHLARHALPLKTCKAPRPAD